ncbi:MAG: hypothetical protein JWN44_2109 [Myxococcales bacterium]|nr:hypothetical protein [Myxococcales bacterium]
MPRRRSNWDRAAGRLNVGLTRFGRRFRRAWRPPRRLSFTREGKYFVGITIGVGFAAINTGNNLLYLLLGMMLSLIIASGIMSELSLRDLTVTRQPPGRIHARRPFLMGIGLSNGKKRLPSFSVEVEDLVGERPLDKKCYFLKLPAGRLQHTSYRHTFPRRGRYTYSGFRLSTKFPFALFRKSRLVELTTEVIVFPQLAQLGHAAAPRARVVGIEAQGRKGRQGDFHGLREFRDGDDPRDIHWRSTAKAGRTLVREHEEEAARRVTVYLDNALPDGAACPDELAKEGLERAISLAASLAADYLERGYAVRVITRGDAIPSWLQGAPQLVRLLRTLALLPTVAPDVPFPAVADGSAEPILVVRKGGPRAAFARVLEA